MAKKIQLTYKEIEDRLREMHDQQIPKTEIGYKILHCFGVGPQAIQRMREGKGVIVLKDRPNTLLVKGLWCYAPTLQLRLMADLEELKNNAAVRKAAPKIIAVSDGVTIRAYDLRTCSTFEQKISRLFCDFEFFYPLAGVEKAEYTDESPADIKAAEKLAKLHDEIRAYNEFSSDSDLHDLNIFIARLLFCFFAEDTGIFESNIFTRAIETSTMMDGSDLQQFLDEAFTIMDVPENMRIINTPGRIKQFPYVGGGLFHQHIDIPLLSAKARQIIIDSGNLDWQDINPDIFGSMIQAVVNPDTRANQGMHYTSVPNIMKVINPLFLDELRAEYNRVEKEVQQLHRDLDLQAITYNECSKRCKPLEKSLEQLLLRMSKMKFFDPACGSGNFLIITYKALRLLEMEIMSLQQKITGQMQARFVGGSMIGIYQFYGIELLDFPHETAMLSLWLAEHQMNRRYNDLFHVNIDALPLKSINQIRCGNACRVDWNEICPHTKDEEVYLFGNPPYLGSRKQDKGQKKDLEIVFKEDYGELDYISAWFVKGAQFINITNSKYAFVTTNSICQGLQVSLLWKRVLKDGLEIEFAYKSFKWRNNAKHNAGVTVTILGVANKSRIKNKAIYDGDKSIPANNISPFLIDMPTIYVENKTKPITAIFPQMNFGNMPADGGLLILSTEEKEMLEARDSIIGKYIRPLIGAEEFINGKQRWCLWLYEEDADDYCQSDEIRRRIDDLREVRLKSSRPQLAEIPHLFAQITQPMNAPIILIPSTSSENRPYIPMGFYDEGNIAANSCMVIGTEDISLFGILTSRIHMDWVRTVGGKLETRYRYSAGLCYNTFPFPKISQAKKAKIEEAATEVLLTREPYLTQGKTLAFLYDPDTMPADLLKAHQTLDDIVESCYPGYPFATDEARLECLFKMYEKMTKK